MIYPKTGANRFFALLRMTTELLHIILMMLSEIKRMAQGAVRAGSEYGGIAQRLTVNPQNMR